MKRAKWTRPPIGTRLDVAFRLWEVYKLYDEYFAASAEYLRRYAATGRKAGRREKGR